MLPLQIKRQRSSNVDHKQVLRAYVDQLPLDKQREFVSLAFQLIAARSGMSQVEMSTSYCQPLQDRTSQKSLER
jgi:hypothetical protein